jgi:hypothetical protein
MTLIQKMQYLLDNDYSQEGEGLDIKFYSKDRTKRFTIRDLLQRWNSLRIF